MSTIACAMLWFITLDVVKFVSVWCMNNIYSADHGIMVNNYAWEKCVRGVIMCLMCATVLSGV